MATPGQLIHISYFEGVHVRVAPTVVGSATLLHASAGKCELQAMALLMCHGLRSP